MKRAHFIGIAGKGMSAVALMLKQKGWQVTGSDSGAYPPVSTYLEKQDISFNTEYKKENIPDEVDVVVIGKNAKLTKETNEEVYAAYERNIPIKSFPEILEELIEDKETIVVAGSYGKSTVTSLITWCLVHTGKNPSYFIGEISRDLDIHGHIGTGDYFVLEGDEYPSSNWDNSSKFLHYKPQNVVLTSAVHDHINIFPTHESYLEPFKKLINLLSDTGTLVCSSEPHARDLCAGHANTIYYGFEDGYEWRADNISFVSGTTFDIFYKDKFVTSIETELFGIHNVQNILAGATLLLSKEIVTPEEFRDAAKLFKGVKRRLELLTENSSVLVYEGFGSSYEKAKTAYEALDQYFSNNRIITIFEPHTFSWRNKEYIHHYDDVFKTSSEVLVYEPASQGKDTHEQLTQGEIVERINQSGTKAQPIHDIDETLKLIKEIVRPDDIIVLMTSGNLGGLIEKLPEFVEKQYPKQHENI